MRHQSHLFLASGSKAGPEDSRHSLRRSLTHAAWRASGVCLLVLVSILAYSGRVSAQSPPVWWLQTQQTPEAPSTSVSWAPECSHNPTKGPKQLWKAWQKDNVGVPLIEQPLPGYYKDPISYSEVNPINQSFQAVSYGTNGTLLVYEKAIENAVFNSNNTMVPVYDPQRVRNAAYGAQEGARVYIQDLDGNGNPGTVFKNAAGNAVGDVGDVGNAERMPRIIQTSDSGYIVTWVSVSSSGTTPERLLMTKYNANGTIYSPSSTPSWNAFPVSAISYGHIHEYTIIPDQNGGMMVLMVVSNDTNKYWRLVCQEIVGYNNDVDPIYPIRYWSSGSWKVTNEQMLEIAAADTNKDFIYNPIIRYNHYNSVNGGVASYDLAWGRIIDSSGLTCLSGNPIRPYLFVQRLALSTYDSAFNTTPISYVTNGENTNLFLAEDGNEYAPFFMVPAAQSTWGNTEAVLIREENWGSCSGSVPIVAGLHLHWFQMNSGGYYDLTWNDWDTIGTYGSSDLYPAGLLADNGSSDNLYVAYYFDDGVGPFHYLIDKVDASTLDRDWHGITAGNTTTYLPAITGNYRADLGQTSDSVFLSLPWVDEDALGNELQGIDVSRIGKHNAAVSTVRMNARRAWRNNSNYCFFSSTLSKKIASGFMPPAAQPSAWGAF